MSQAKEYIVKVKSANYVDNLIRDLSSWNVRVSNVSKVGFYGFSANLGNLISKWLKDDPRVASIEPIINYDLQAVQEIASDTMWYLDRIDQPSLPLNGYFSYDKSGNDVVIYTVDSGISTDHVELSNQCIALRDPNFPTLIFDPVIDQRLHNSDSSYNEAFQRGADELGHGTFIAGLLVSPTYGVAKGAELRSAKVFGQMTASSGRILAGLNAVYQDYLASGKPKSVLNISFANIADPLVITSTGTSVPLQSSFTINSHLITSVTGSLTEIATKINQLSINGVVSEVQNNRLLIKLTKLGSIVLTDGALSPLATIGIASGVHAYSVNLVEQALIAMSNDGMHIVMSAGNYGIDASLVTPARISSVIPAITVGATDRNDALADFSKTGDAEVSIGNISGIANPKSCFGPSVNIYAPGMNMQSTWRPSYNVGGSLQYNDVMVSSGTSYASPLVAGAIAIALETTQVTPSVMRSMITSAASSGVITGLPAGSNNKILNLTAIDAEIQWVANGPFINLARHSYYEMSISAYSFNGPASRYEVVAGTLPIGLVLDSNTGRISGTISHFNPIGNNIVEVKAYNGHNESISDTNGVTNIVFGIVDGTQPVRWITDFDLGSVKEGSPVNIVLEAINMVSADPIAYSVVGVLPHGWVLVGNQILGTAPMATNGDFKTGFSISAYDGFTHTTREFEINIDHNEIYGNENEPYWVTPTGTVGVFAEGSVVEIQLEGIDENSDPRPLTYNLEVSSGDGSHFGPFGDLPPGLALDPETGIISGTIQMIPDDFARYDFAVFLSDGANVVSNLFSILAYKQHAMSDIIWETPPGTLGSFLKDDDVDILLKAHDTIGLSINYFIGSGELPNGLNLGIDGRITGTISDNIKHLHVFTVYASNGYKIEPATFTIATNKINTSPIWITGSELGAFPEGSFINILLIAEDQDGDVLTFESDNIPSGLYLNGPYLRGTLGAVDVDTELHFTITVSDQMSNITDSISVDKDFVLIVKDGALNPNAPPMWLTPFGPLPSGISNTKYITSLIATDPDGDNLTYVIDSGILPPGLTLNRNTGVISGDIEPHSSDAGYDFVVLVSDGQLEVERAFNIFISSSQENYPPVWVTGSNLGPVVAGEPKVINFVANDPEGTVVTYSLVSGILPPGMLFNNATGQLSGIPSNTGTANATFQFTIRATDFNQSYADQQFTITVVDTLNMAPIWLTPSGQLTSNGEPLTFHPGQYISFQFEAFDLDEGPLPLVYRLTYNSSLPYGITINPDGLLSGYVGDVYSTQELGIVVEVTDGVSVTPRNFVLKFVPTPSYTGISCDLYMPVSMDLVHMIRDWNIDSLIPDSILYKEGTPGYGRMKDYDIMISKNLYTSDKNLIQDSLGEHHKKFGSLMGIPTYAVGRNVKGDVEYEVIFIPMVDMQRGSDFDIYNHGQLEYVSKSFDHLRKELRHIENGEVLPAWMRFPQTKGGEPLGYIPAIVLAYVQPGKAESVVQSITQVVNQTRFVVQETTFDRNVMIGEYVDPYVEPGAQMTIGNVLVTFNGGSVDTAKYDIEQALTQAGNNEIKVYLVENVEFRYDGSTLYPVYGYSLRLNFVSNFITLANVTGTPCEDLGFMPITSVETSFDGQSLKFDYTMILDENQNKRSGGLTFVGKELIFDRYVGNLSNGQNFQIKWAPDQQETFYDSHKEEFWTANPPIWITPPGELGEVVTGIPAAIQLKTKYHLVDQIVSYEVVFGSLPDGFALNSSTGIISGTAHTPGETTFFTIRAHDRWGNYSDRGFTLTAGENLLKIRQNTILIDGSGVKI